MRTSSASVGDEVAPFSAARRSAKLATKASIAPRSFGCGCAALSCVRFVLCVELGATVEANGWQFTGLSCDVHRTEVQRRDSAGACMATALLRVDWDEKMANHCRVTVLDCLHADRNAISHIADIAGPAHF